MSQDLPATSYALLGLLTFGDDLTGYELKQRADLTLRFYWVAPAMSQVYTELERLARRGLVSARESSDAERRSTRYRITAHGRRALVRWLEESPVGFPILKHPVALRLLMGHLVDPARTVTMLSEHLDALAERRAELEEVRTSLRGADGAGEPFQHPAMVAEWGLEYFDGERATLERLLARLQTPDDG